MNALALSGVAVIVSVGSLSWLGLYVIRIAPDAPALKSDEFEASKLELLASAVDKRVSDLEAQLAQLKSDGTRPNSTVPPSADATPGNVDWRAEFDALTKRIEALESAMSLVSVTNGHSKDENAARDALLVGSKLAGDALDGYRTQFLDVGADLAQRLAALRMMRRFPKEMNAFNDAVIDASIQLIQSGHDSATRLAVVSELSATKNERLAAPLLELANHAGDDRLQGQAVEALTPYGDRADVRGVLEQLANESGSKEVKWKALRVLAAIDKGEKIR